MKISVDIDCSPAEAREFLGLPDVAAVQEMVLEEMKKKMAGGLEAMDPGQMLQSIFPQQAGGWGDLQKAFWTQMTGRAGDSEGK